MRARLYCRLGRMKGADFEIGREAVIGRSTEHPIVLDDSAISNTHARIIFDADRGCYYLEDLDSVNGTLLDGGRVQGRERLGPLHVIAFAGELEFFFQMLSHEPEPEARPTAEEGGDTGQTVVDKLPAPLPASLLDIADGAEAAGEPDGTRIEREVIALPDALVEPAEAGSAEGDSATSGSEDPAGTRIERQAIVVPANLAADDSPVSPSEVSRSAGAAGFALEFTVGEDRRRVPLAEGESVVGRSRSVEIRIDYPELSRRHALLTVREGQVTVRDLKSRNHTYLNGEKVVDEVTLEVGSKLGFGSLEVELVKEA